MKKEVSPIVGVLGILITLTVVMLGYWFGLVGGGKEKVQPKANAKTGGKPEETAAEASGPAVVTLAGGGQPGYADGPAAESLFSGPSSVAVDRDGAVYVADSRNNCIRKIAANGIVTTLAGTTTEGFADGVGAATRFSGPAAITLAPDGSLFVSDTGNHRLRRIARDGAVSTLAGSDTPKDDIGRASGGSKDGPAAQAQFRYPVGLAIDAAGTVYVADAGNHCVRRSSSAGQVTTIAVSGGQMDSPTELALIGDRLWVSDTGKGQLWMGPREGPLQPWRLAGKQKGPKAPSGPGGRRRRSLCCRLRWPLPLPAGRRPTHPRSWQARGLRALRRTGRGGHVLSSRGAGGRGGWQALHRRLRQQLHPGVAAGGEVTGGSLSAD